MQLSSCRDVEGMQSWAGYVCRRPTWVRGFIGGRAHAGMGGTGRQYAPLWRWENPMTTGKENNAKLARRFRLVTMVSSSRLQPFWPASLTSCPLGTCIPRSVGQHQGCKECVLSLETEQHAVKDEGLWQSVRLVHLHCPWSIFSCGLWLPQAFWDNIYTRMSIGLM